MKKGNKGFTLIELLVVIAIIAILSTVVMAGLNSARAKARDARRLSDIKQLSTALNLYFDSCGGYPNFGSASDIPIGTPGDDTTQLGPATAIGCSGGTTFGSFMSTIPTNPIPGGADYVYCSAANADPATCAASTESYILKFNLESGSGTLAAGDHTATPGGTQ